MIWTSTKILLIGDITSYKNSKWHKFWWWDTTNDWPAAVNNVLEKSHGMCVPGESYCFLV